MQVLVSDQVRHTQIDFSKSGRTIEQRLLGPPKTYAYRPTLAMNLPWFAGPGGWGMFSLGIIDEMRRDWQVSQASLFKSAPLFTAEFKVRASSRAVAEYVHEFIRRFWTKSLGYALECVPYGYSAAESIWKEEKGVIKFDSLKPLHPRDVKPYTFKGKLYYVKLKNLSGQNINDEGVVSHSGIELDSARRGIPAKGVWFVHMPRYHQWYGMPQAMPAWWPWRLKTMPDGAMETLFKAYYKHAFSGTIVRHPNMIYQDEPGGPQVSAKDYAQQIGEQVKAGANFALNTDRDEHGEYLWQFEKYGGEMPADFSTLMSYPDWLDKLIVRGWGIPDEIITHDGNTGGFSRSNIAFLAFLIMAEEQLNHIIESLKDQLITPAVYLNYGKQAWYELEAEPLLQDPQQAEQQMQQGQQQGQDAQQDLNGQGLAPPVAQPPGANGQQPQPQQPQNGQQFLGQNIGQPKNMSLNLEDLDLSSRAEWVSEIGPKGGHRWVNSRNHERVIYSDQDPNKHPPVQAVAPQARMRNQPNPQKPVPQQPKAAAPATNGAAKPVAQPQPQSQPQPAQEQIANPQQAMAKLTQMGKDSWGAIMRGEEKVTEPFKRNFHKLPRKLQYALAGAAKLYFSTYYVAEKAARSVANEIGGEKHAKLVGAMIAVGDIFGAKAIPTAALASGVGVGAAVMSAWIPLGSLSYLAFATGTHPLKTLQSAKKAIHGLMSMGKPQTIAASMSIDHDHDLQGLLLRRMIAHPDHADWYAALVMSALDETKDLRKAIQLADEAMEQRASNHVDFAIVHAPKGGIRINGDFFPGGEFIPPSVISEASQQDKQKLGIKEKTNPNKPIGQGQPSVKPQQAAQQGQFGDAKPTDFMKGRSQVPRSVFLTDHTEEQLAKIISEGGKVRLSNDGKTGYVLSKDMDLQNVFNTGAKGGGKGAVIDAIASGANTLDCFDGFLPNYYSKFGFKPYKTIKWDDQYAPDGWDYEKYGRPDVVFMKYEGGTRDRREIEGRFGNFGMDGEGQKGNAGSADKGTRGGVGQEASGASGGATQVSGSNVGPDRARVGVPAFAVPTDAKEIPRLPHLTKSQAAVESAFANRYGQNPDELVDKYLRALEKRYVGVYPNVFATDDVKMLNRDWNPERVKEGEKLPDDMKHRMAKYNLVVHQTANAVAKKAFLKYLDTKVSKYPEGDPRRSVFVTNGGCAAGKGSTVSKSTKPGSPYFGMVPAPEQVGAIWDAAGEQCATENQWIYDECKKRGIKPIFSYVYANPKDKWEGGVIRRAVKKGRMVDARLFADSYALGAKNMAQFAEKHKDDGTQFIFVDNRDKKRPKLLNEFPKEALNWDAEKIYKHAVDVLKDKRHELDKTILEGGLNGTQVWGPPAKAR